MNRSGRKPEMEYPCLWGYKVIGAEPDRLRLAIAEVLQERPHSVTPSHSSQTGKYICLDVELTVLNEDVRLEIYEALRRHPAVKIVL